MTWRYSAKHAELRARRTQYPEMQFRSAVAKVHEALDDDSVGAAGKEATQWRFGCFQESPGSEHSEPRAFGAASSGT